MGIKGWGKRFWKLFLLIKKQTKKIFWSVFLKNKN